MCGACTTHGREKESREFGSECLRGRDYLEDLGIDGMKILKFMLWKWGVIV
jgi:hypothetical protein